MDHVLPLPRVAFVINQGTDHSNGANVARSHHLVHLFTGHRLPATWAVDNAERASLLQTHQSAAAKIEFALKIDPQWCSPTPTRSKFRTELSSRILGLQAVCGTTTHLVVGDPQLLRSRAAALAELGIGGILSEEPTDLPRPLPCGLWQLGSGLRIPQKRRLTSFLTRRRPSAKQLMAANTTATTLVVVDSFELERAQARTLQSFERLLLEVSWAASRNQLVVSTVSEVLADLANQRAVKPQRSILRTAA